MKNRRLSITHRFRLLHWAEKKKWNKYTWSGLLFILGGLILIGFAISLKTRAYSPEGLLIGIGAIVVIVGIIRVLIGVINPAIPEDLEPYTDQNNEKTLQDQMFSHEGEIE